MMRFVGLVWKQSDTSAPPKRGGLGSLASKLWSGSLLVVPIVEKASPYNDFSVQFIVRLRLPG